jgi:NitT/TauT family transport system ATP-binding protein
MGILYMPERIGRNYLLPLLFIMLLLLLWEQGAASGDSQDFPSPSGILDALFHELDNDNLVVAISQSLSRIFIGFGIAFVVACLLSVIFSAVPFFKTLINPIITLISSIPPIAWTPLAIVWFGIGDETAVFIVCLGAFFPLFIAFYTAIRDIPARLISVGRTLGLRGFGELRHIAFPQVQPQIFVGIRTAIIVAWFNVIAAELVGVSTGLGYQIQLNRTLLMLDRVLLYMAVIGFLGIIMAAVIAFVERVAIPWHFERHSPFYFSINRMFKRIFNRGFAETDGSNVSGDHPGSPEARREGAGRSLVELSQVSYSFDGSENVLSGIDFALKEGEIVALMGSNGCGKSTLMNIVAGFIAPGGGTALFDGRLIAGPSTDRTIIFQHGILFPWLTAWENSSFAARYGNGDLAEADRLFRTSGLEPFRDYFPSRLSGGMRQRVALIRGVAANARLLILDEPFSELDPLSRWDLQDYARELIKGRNVSAIVVTHDIEEAAYLADRIVVMGPRGTPLQGEVRVEIQERSAAVRSTPEFLSVVSNVHDMLLESKRAREPD